MVNGTEKRLEVNMDGSTLAFKLKKLLEEAMKGHIFKNFVSYTKENG